MSGEAPGPTSQGGPDTEGAPDTEDTSDTGGVSDEDATASAVADGQPRSHAHRTTVIVTVDDDLPGTLPALESAGLRVERTLVTLSIVIGTVDDDGERAIASMRGVHVEREQTIHVGPPGGPQ